MGDKVELDFQQLSVGGDRRCAEPSGGDVERHVPAVIQPGRQRQPDLADDLCPELQGEGCVPPFSIGQIWPCLREVDRRHLSFLRLVRVLEAACLCGLGRTWEKTPYGRLRDRKSTRLNSS